MYAVCKSVIVPRPNSSPYDLSSVQALVYLKLIAVAIGLVIGRPLPWLLVWQLVMYEHVTLVAKVTVSIVSTTARLTVECSIDLATVDRTIRRLISRGQTAFVAVWLCKTRWSLGNDDCIETP